ncbi:MAG: DUF4382 domain-containing protein [Gammaproteobacteria bacterium]|nr:DUF4382 domain-containing protein [Gammaproteobacteria bacterium]MDE2346230.1 DUF4382 domain-containing protein [Gammaproteobacteria bacterium]
MPRIIARCAAVLFVLLLSACGGGNPSPTLNLYMADAPTDQISAANISISEVTVTGDNGTLYYPFPAVTTLNFFALQGGLSAFLINVPLPAGHYTAITLYLEAAPGTTQSNVTLTGSGVNYPLVIPDGKPTKYTLPVNFIVYQNISANYTVDLNLRSSILPDPTNPYQFILQPDFRIIDNNDAGMISGTVAPSLVPSGCSPTVYVYSGQVTPTDVNVNAPPGTVQPISSALVGINFTTALYNFTVAWLPPGIYTVAFTCQAPQDDPTTADNITFSPVITATVNARQTTFVNIN